MFLTKPALRDFDLLLSVLLDLRLGMFNVTVAGFTPTARGRRYEALRPDLADLLPIAQRVLAAVVAVSCVLAVVLGAHGALAQTSKMATPGRSCTVAQQVSVGLDLNLPVGTSVARADCDLTMDSASAAAAWLAEAGWVLPGTGMGVRSLVHRRLHQRLTRDLVRVP